MRSRPRRRRHSRFHGDSELLKVGQEHDSRASQKRCRDKSPLSGSLGVLRCPVEMQDDDLLWIIIGIISGESALQ